MASYSGLFNADYSKTAGAPATYSPVHSNSLKISGTATVIDSDQSVAMKMSRLIRPTRANKKLRAYLQAAIGAAAGGSVNSAAAVNWYQAGHPTTPVAVGGLGGSRTVDTIELVAASTTTAAADNTNLKAMFSKTFVPGTYPTDASGNGGGGKLTATYRLV